MGHPNAGERQVHMAMVSSCMILSAPGNMAHFDDLLSKQHIFSLRTDPAPAKSRTAVLSLFGGD